MYKQVLDPVGNSLFLSTLFAALPLITLFVLLGGLKLKAHVAALWSLLVAILVAIIVYSMPVGQTLDAGAEGAAFGLFPIMWIVVNAIWIYTMLERSGYFAVIKRSFGRLSDDQRVQAVLIAFCFGALLEALAGFGTPVAICSVMLIGLGFQPAKAAAVALVANTAPVAFGAIAVPITTLAPLANLPKDDLGAMVGRQTPFLALRRPADPRRHGRRAPRHQGRLARRAGGRPRLRHRPVRVLELPLGRAGRRRRLAGRRRARSSRCCSSGSPARSSACPPARARPWPAARAASTSGASRRRRALRADAGPDGNLKRDTPAEIITAFSPYLILIAVFALAQIHWLPFFDWLDARTKAFDWPGLHVLNAEGQAADGDPLQVQLGQRRRHAAADLRPAEHDHAARQRAARARGLRGHAEPAQVRDPHRRDRAGAGLRHEPVGPDDHDRQRGWPAPARPSRCSRRSSAGWASRSPARTRRPTRCSAPCRCRRPRRPTSRRCSWPPRTRAAACSAR